MGKTRKLSSVSESRSTRRRRNALKTVTEIQCSQHTREQLPTSRPNRAETRRTAPALLWRRGLPQAGRRRYGLPLLNTYITSSSSPASPETLPNAGAKAALGFLKPCSVAGARSRQWPRPEVSGHSPPPEEAASRTVAPAGHLPGGSCHRVLPCSVLTEGQSQLGLKYASVTKNRRFSATWRDYKIRVVGIFRKNAGVRSCKGNLLCRHNSVFWKLTILAVEMLEVIKQ